MKAKTKKSPVKTQRRPAARKAKAIKAAGRGKAGKAAKGRRGKITERPPLPKRVVSVVQTTDGGTMEIVHQERANGVPPFPPPALTIRDRHAIAAERSREQVEETIRKMSGRFPR